MSISASPPLFDQGPARVLSLGDLSRALWRNLWLIGLFGLVAGTVALVTARLKPPSYQAFGLVSVEAERFAIPELQGAVSGDLSLDPLPRVRSEVLVLRSPSLIRAVSDELNLRNNPDFNPALREPGLLGGVKQYLRTEMPWLFSAQPSTDEETIRQAAAGEATRRLGVSHDNRTFVVSVAFTAPDPELAANFVNTLIRRYITLRAESRTRMNVEANSSLTRRVQEMREEVQALDAQVRELRQKHGLVATRALSVGQQRLEELTAAATRAAVERTEAEADQRRVVELVRRGASGELADVLNSQTMARLRDREAEASKRMAEVGSRYGTRHPDYRSAELELGAVRRQITDESGRYAASIDARVGVARQKEASARAQLQEALEAANVAAAVQSELTQLEREADARRSLYQTLLARAEQTAVDPRGLEQEPAARVVSLAEAPSRPSGMQPSMVAAIGTVGGLVVGTLGAILRGRSPVGFASPRELAETTGLPLVGALPRSLSRRRGGGATAWVRGHRAGPESETLRSIRNRVRRLWSGPAPRSILFVAAGGRIDASDLAAAFASVAAFDGERVMLVEGDLREAGLSKCLQLRPNASAPHGLLSVLVGKAAWREAVAEDAQAPLHVLATGPVPDFTPDMPSSMRLQSALGEMVRDYNLVVVGGPPVSAMSEVATLARGIDCVLLLVPAQGVRRASVRQAAEQLAQASSSTIGLVFCE